MNEQDRAVGRLLIQRGLVPRDRLPVIAADVERRRAGGQQVEVLSVLVEQGLLDAARARSIWQEIVPGAQLALPAAAAASGSVRGMSGRQPAPPVGLASAESEFSPVSTLSQMGEEAPPELKQPSWQPGRDSSSFRRPAAIPPTLVPDGPGFGGGVIPSTLDPDAVFGSAPGGFGVPPTMAPDGPGFGMGSGPLVGPIGGDDLVIDDLRGAAAPTIMLGPGSAGPATPLPPSGFASAFGPGGSGNFGGPGGSGNFGGPGASNNFGGPGGSGNFGGPGGSGNFGGPGGSGNFGGPGGSFGAPPGSFGAPPASSPFGAPPASPFGSSPFGAPPASPFGAPPASPFGAPPPPFGSSPPGADTATLPPKGPNASSGRNRGATAGVKRRVSDRVRSPSGRAPAEGGGSGGNKAGLLLVLGSAVVAIGLVVGALLLTSGDPPVDPAQPGAGTTPDPGTTGGGTDPTTGSGKPIGGGPVTPPPGDEPPPKEPAKVPTIIPQYQKPTNQAQLDATSEKVAEIILGRAKDFMFDERFEDAMKILDQFPEDLKGGKGYREIGEGRARMEKLEGWRRRLDDALKKGPTSPELLDLIRHIEGNECPEELYKLDVTHGFREKARNLLGEERYNELTVGAKEFENEVKPGEGGDQGESPPESPLGGG